MSSPRRVVLELELGTLSAIEWHQYWSWNALHGWQIRGEKVSRSQAVTELVSFAREEMDRQARAIVAAIESKLPPDKPAEEKPPEKS